MKKLAKAAAILLALSLVLVGCQKKGETGKPPKAKFHIGVVTGTVGQSEDDLRGAEQLIKEYGAVQDGGMIQHITYPDDFMSQQETIISNIVALADDPMMKAIVVNQAIPGTTEAFKRVKAKRPDILLLAGEPHEDPLVIQSGEGRNASRPVCILCDGTTFYKTHKIFERVAGYLDEVLIRQRGLYYEIISRANDITLGAAIAGLIVK